MQVGTMLIVPFGLLLTYLIILVIFLLLLLRRITKEEQLMTEEFGERYLEYKNQVPLLVPGSYLRRRKAN